ncbi:MAG: metal-dependent hydrolase [Alphaproteobacteria bacterium]|nr:metal-dependent hydrolase [Alphaproteobacteria bacterium]
MDSVTQLVLGAAVGAAVLGPAVGPRKAALIGAVMGTVPDLDVFVPMGDPVSDFVLHRGPSHSLIVHALVTPLFAEPLVRLFERLRDRRAFTYLAVFLCFATHALLDAVTIYGTRIFWPLMPDPVGLGSLFIIDPLYSLPLIVLFVWALCLKQWNHSFARGVSVALIASTAYLGWSMAAQQIALARGQAALERLGVEPERTVATPMPFNTLFWRVIAIEPDRYLNVYVPLLGGDDALTAYAHPRGGDLLACADTIETATVLSDFSKGFFKLWEVDGRLRVSDLRMGVTPNYVFQFEVAERDGGTLTALVPVRLPTVRGGNDQDIAWLWSGITGNRAVRSTEAEALFDGGEGIRVAGPMAPPSSACSPG